MMTFIKRLITTIYNNYMNVLMHFYLRTLLNWLQISDVPLNFCLHYIYLIAVRRVRFEFDDGPIEIVRIT